jgi:hypothetical protein
MEQFTTKIIKKKVQKKEMESLPNTPFFIRDNESMDKTIFMVVKNEKNYSYINFDDGSYVGHATSTEKELLDRINRGQDTLLISELILTNE